MCSGVFEFWGARWRRSVMEGVSSAWLVESWRIAARSLSSLRMMCWMAPYRMIRWSQNPINCGTRGEVRVGQARTHARTVTLR
jgi:hypothetical protein